MQQLTDRTVRSQHQWVKVTRDSKKRTFTLARGWAGTYAAHDVSTTPFKIMPTWADAMERATFLLYTYG